MSVEVAAIVLAAGESSRMGQPKPLLPLDGDTFLGHLLQQLQSSRVRRVVVVLGHGAEEILQAIPELGPVAVINPRYPLGQLSSLHTGLDALAEQADAFLLCLADHPFIPPTVVNALIDAYESTGRPIIVPTFQGRRGHPVLFGRSLFGELRAAPLEQGARSVVWAHAGDVLELPTEEEGILADVDTPDQYQGWLARWRAQR